MKILDLNDFYDIKYKNKIEKNYLQFSKKRMKRRTKNPLQEFIVLFFIFKMRGHTAKSIQ